MGLALNDDLSVDFCDGGGINSVNIEVRYQASKGAENGEGSTDYLST